MHGRDLESRDALAELLVALGLPSPTVMAAEADLRANSHWNPWLVLYLILLMPAVILAIADRVLVRNPAMIPDVIRPVWPHRQVIVAGLDTDYLGRPFTPIPELLCLAESITKTLAICMRCGNPAKHTQRRASLLL